MDKEQIKKLKDKADNTSNKGLREALKDRVKILTGNKTVLK